MALLAEPKRKQKLGIDPNNKNWANDSNAFGQSMMKKMGWTEGAGLGANEDGRVIPVKASMKIDNRGLGCNTRLDADSWIAHQEGFDEVLALLNNNSETNNSENAAKDSTEAKSEEGSRRFYGRFSRGRVKQLRTAEDLDSILGRRKSSGKSQAENKEEIKEDKSSTDESDENDDKEKDGFVTVTSSCSVQDYFAQKMKAKNIALPSMTKTQDENEDVNKVAEESDGFQDKWSGNGYRTSTTSVQGYFAQKMKMKKARLLPLPVNRCDEEDNSQPQDSKTIQNDNVSVEEDVSNRENHPVAEDQVDSDDKKNPEKESSKERKKRKKSSLDDDDDTEESNKRKKRRKNKGSKQELQSDVCAEEMEITEEQSDAGDNSKTKRKSKKKKDCHTEISEQNIIPDESNTSDSKIAKNKRKSGDDGDETKSLAQNDDCDNCSEGSKSNNSEDATCDTVIKEKKKRRKNKKKKALLKTAVEKNESELDKEVDNTNQDQCEETQIPKADDEKTIEEGESGTVPEEDDDSTAPETSEGKSSRNAKKKMKIKMKKIIFKRLEDMKNLKWEFGLNKVKETSGTVYNDLMNDNNVVLGKLRGRILDKVILEGKKQSSSQPQNSKKEIKKLNKQIENLKKTYLDQAETEKKNCLEKLEKVEASVIKKVKESTKKNISVINKMSENSHSDAAMGWEAKIGEVKTLKKKIVSDVKEKKEEIIQDIEKRMNDATEKIQEIEKQASVRIEEIDKKLSTEEESFPFPGANGVEGYCYHKNSNEVK